MPQINVELDEETYQALMTDASMHARPTRRHAGWMLRAGLGLVMAPASTAEEIRQRVAKHAQSPVIAETGHDD